MKFKFTGPDGTQHSFEVPNFVVGTTPSEGNVDCDCGQEHAIYHSHRFDHGIRLGEIKPKNAPYDQSRTYRYSFSFVDKKLFETPPPSTKL